MFHTLKTMTIRGIHRNSLRTRSIAALGAGVLALSGLAACGSDDSEGETDQAASSESAEVTAEESEAAPEGGANPEAEAKRTEREQLALGADEVEGLPLQEITQEQFTQTGTLTEQLTGNTSMQSDPPECADVFQKLQGTGGADTSAAVGRLGQDPKIPNTAFTLVLNDPSATAADYTSAFEQCGDVRMTMDLPGQDGQPQQITYTMTNEVTGAAAPEGTEDFFSVKNTSNADIQGQPVTSGIFLVSGNVNGTAIQVNAQSNAGPISPEAEQRALDLFNRQAQKLQNA